MTIAERHEALVQFLELKSRTDQERHEALTQTVGLLTHDIQQMKVIVNEVVRGIEGLVAIARSHERRISILET